ncbi:MAG: EpsI family protein [Planctomycetes bacterium]|nr:EpsI family protein [Planctomycetota bacterium]
MRTLNQRYAVAIALLALSAPLVLYLNYSIPPPSKIDSVAAAIPRRLGKWVAEGPDGRGTPQEEEILQTDAILNRTYRCARLADCTLNVVYAQDNPNAVHPPELCYKGSGWTEKVRDTVPVAVGEEVYELNRRQFARGTGELMWVLYWYKAGPASYRSYWGFFWATFVARLKGVSCSCSLVQVRSEFRDPDYAGEVFAELRKFAIEAIPATNAAIP